jgi:hypothetical protein
MGNVIYENENILVAAGEDDISVESEAETSEETTVAEHTTDEDDSFPMVGIVINVVFYTAVIIGIVKLVKKKKAEKEARRVAEEERSRKEDPFYWLKENDPNFERFVHLVIAYEGVSHPNNYFVNLYQWYGSWDNYYAAMSGQNSNQNNYNNSNNGYGNNQSNYSNSDNSTQESANPFADKFEGKTPDEARKIYLKYMKAFRSDTGDGSDDEEVKLINAAYDEYKKSHGIN